MPISTTNFIASDFTSNKPAFLQVKGNASNLKFATKTKKIQFTSTTSGVAVITVTFTGTVDYISLNFTDEFYGNVTVSNTLNGLYQTSGPNSAMNCIMKDETRTNSTRTFYVAVNSNSAIVSNYLLVAMAVGKLNTPPSSASITLNYTCPDVNPIYMAETGLHVYSPYDAQFSISKLNTRLYSLTPVNAWSTSTLVYSSPTLSNPALPYYYGVGDVVIKVGDPYDRAFGTRKQTTVKKRLFSKPKIRQRTTPPFSSFNKNNQTSLACLSPIMGNVGRIMQVLPNVSLTQPLQYRYYMGFDALSKTMANDSVFVTYNWNSKKNYPIIGSTHALGRVTQGITSGYDVTIDIGDYFASLTSASKYLTPEYSSLIAAGASLALIAASFLDLAVNVTIACGSCPLGATAVVALPLGPVFLVVGGIVALYGLYKFFLSFETKVYDEECTIFLHHFTDTPYIEEGHTLFRNPLKTIKPAGYLSDGIYYYTQNETILTKELSSTNSITSITIEPPPTEFVTAIQPDVPVFVEDFTKLLVLPYTSGKPMPNCGTGVSYENTTLTASVTGTQVCAFEIADPQVITIEAGTTVSCISVADANAEAQRMLNAAVALANAKGNYFIEFTDEQVGSIDTAFTHELKVENIPTNISLCFDARTSSVVSVGTTLYYDPCGCTKVLNGYYAVTGTNPFKTFYHTTNSIVDHIYYMSTSGSTSTTTGEPIILTNLDYTSNWYYTRMNKETLDEACFKMDNTIVFNPNTLYSDTSLKKGFIRTTGNNIDFKVYDSFISTTYSEAATGWYTPLIDWIISESFYYYRSAIVSLNIIEDCSYLTTTNPRGFYVASTINSTETPPANPVNISVNVYSGTTVLATYTVDLIESDNRTFVNYNNMFSYSTPITSISIVSINSTNPINKSIYTIGASTLCVSPTTLPPLTIGSSHEGGIVVRILQPNDVGYNPSLVQGLLMSPTVLASGIQWSREGPYYNANTSSFSAYGYGLSNSNKIIALEPISSSPYYAAALCRSYNSGGFTDWFLPTQTELSYAWQYYKSGGLPTFTEPLMMWTSNEVSSGNILVLTQRWEGLSNSVITIDKHLSAYATTTNGAPITLNIGVIACRYFATTIAGNDIY